MSTRKNIIAVNSGDTELIRDTTSLKWRIMFKFNFVHTLVSSGSKGFSVFSQEELHQKERDVKFHAVS